MTDTAMARRPDRLGPRRRDPRRRGASPSASVACRPSTTSRSRSPTLDRLDHRPQRRRQDDVLQHAHRALPPDGGRDPLRRRDDITERRPKRSAHEARRRAHLPEHPPVRDDDGGRERARRPARAHEGRLVGSIVRSPRQRREEREALDHAREMLDYVGLGATSDQLAINLSYGDQRRVEIARALASDPKLLLLDEPTAGMNPNESAQLTDFIRRLRDERGLTVLLIEHDMKVVMGVSRAHHRARPRREDRRGRPGRPSARNPRVIEAYLGKRESQGGPDGVWHCSRSRTSTRTTATSRR